MINGSEPFKLNLPDGGELRLSLIRPADWLTYTDRFRTMRKVRWGQSLLYAETPTDEMIKKLNEFDSRKLSANDVMQWVTELDGAGEMLALSISHGWELWRDGQCVEKHEPTAATIQNIPPTISHLDYVEAAAGVAGLQLVEKDQPDPNVESVSQSIATGGATQTESVPG